MNRYLWQSLYLLDLSDDNPDASDILTQKNYTGQHEARPQQEWKQNRGQLNFGHHKQGKLPNQFANYVRVANNRPLRRPICNWGLLYLASECEWSTGSKAKGFDIQDGKSKG